MRSTFTIWGLLLALIGPLANAEEAPSAHDLIEKSNRVLGYESPAISIGSIEAHAHVTVGERSYDTIVQSQISAEGFSDTSFTIIEAEGMREYRVIGETPSAVINGGEPQTLAPAMAAFIHGHQFHRRVLFPKWVLTSYSQEVETTNFAGVPAQFVSGKTKFGGDLVYFFDASTNRMLGFRLTIMEETGLRPMDFILKDWRTQGGQTLFWRIDIHDKDDVYVYEFNKILLLP